MMVAKCRRNASNDSGDRRLKDGRLLVAEQRPIVCSEPVIPLEIAEFDSGDLADVRQRVIMTQLSSAGWPL
jgi:hypothetical protein